MVLFSFNYHRRIRVRHGHPFILNKQPVRGRLSEIDLRSNSAKYQVFSYRLFLSRLSHCLSVYLSFGSPGVDYRHYDLNTKVSLNLFNAHDNQ